MRAVNLLPPELRGTSPAAAPRVRREKVEGVGGFIVLGVLAVCVLALAGYVLASNTVKQRTADLQTAQARATAASQKAAALKPYADFEALATARVETVRGLAAARFDWAQSLRDLARAAPADVKLVNFSGDMGMPAAVTGADPLRSSIQSPAITLAGCASSQRGVARMLARIRAVDGVTRVALSKSEKSSVTAGSESPCAGDAPPSFSLVIFFERSAAAAALAPAGDTESSVPVPNVVNESSDASETPATATPAAGAAATPTPTPTASTP
jgi:Tfp pilus assembly protein PilN